MTTLPGSPKVMKGAIAGIDPFDPLAGVIIFRHDPGSLTPRAMHGGRNR